MHNSSTPLPVLQDNRINCAQTTPEYSFYTGNQHCNPTYPIVGVVGGDQTSQTFTVRPSPPLPLCPSTLRPLRPPPQLETENSYVRRRPSEESYQENAHTSHQRPPMMPRLVASGGVRNDRRYSGVSHPDDDADLYSREDADLYYGGGTTGAQGGGGGGAHSSRVAGSASPLGGMPQDSGGGGYSADDSRSALSGVGGDGSKGFQECSWRDDVPCGDAGDDGPPFPQACASEGGESCFGSVGGLFGDDGRDAEWGIAGNSDDEFSDFLNDIVDEFGIEGNAEIVAGAHGPNFI